jgi:hypothetical protein
LACGQVLIFSNKLQSEQGFLFFFCGLAKMLITFLLNYCICHIYNVYLYQKLKQSKMKAIINRTQNFGTLNGVITKNEEIRKVVNQHLKQGTAKLLVDTEETLMYELGEQKPNSNMHPIFEQALKPFGIR